MSIFERYEQFKDKTFREAADKYLDHFKGKSRKRQYYALLHVMPYIGDLKLIDVDDSALEEYKRDRIKFAMVGTINKELRTVTTVLNKAARVWRWIPSAPLIQTVQGDHRKPYPLSWPEQIAEKALSTKDSPTSAHDAISEPAVMATHENMRREGYSPSERARLSQPTHNERGFPLPEKNSE